MINPDGQAVFGLRQGELGGLPERFIQLGNVGVVDVRIPHLAQAFAKSVLPLVRDLEVICVILPFITMRLPGTHALLQNTGILRFAQNGNRLI